MLEVGQRFYGESREVISFSGVFPFVSSVIMPPAVRYIEVLSLTILMSLNLSRWTSSLTSPNISCYDVFFNLIAHFANFCFVEDCFLSCFKHALVTSFLKKPDFHIDSLSNFRPTCKLNSISKFLKRLLLKLNGS